MKLARTEGEAVVRNEKARELEPFVDMNLYSGYQMETNPESYAWINLDDVKLIKMDQNSDIEIQYRNPWPMMRPWISALPQWL